jgi:hypothetical protein
MIPFSKTFFTHSFINSESLSVEKNFAFDRSHIATIVFQYHETFVQHIIENQIRPIRWAKGPESQIRTLDRRCLLHARREHRSGHAGLPRHGLSGLVFTSIP